MFCFVFSTEILLFFFAFLRVFFFAGLSSSFRFRLCEAHNARNLQSSRTTRPQFDRIKKSIMARRAFFFLFFRPFFLLLLPLGGRACARSALSRVCFRERFFVFLRLAMGSRSRAPVLWDRATRMTVRETNGFIRSLSGCERFFSRSNVTQNFFSGGVF